MATSTCYASLQACMLRVAELTQAGAPLTGASHGYATNSVVQIQVGVTVEAGTDITQKNGCGAICAAFKQPDRIKSLALSMNLCHLDAELIAMLTGGATISSSGNVVGFEYPAVTGSDPTPVSIEVWSKAWDGNAQAVPAATSPSVAYFHFVFPFTRWTLGQVTVDDTLMVVPVTGIGSENSQLTANGPFDDWPVYVSAHGGIARVGGVFLDSAIPSDNCGSIAVTSAGS